MVATALADLDELILLCRDDRARIYIAEAVACYKAGAFRSAIVATWVAVCYDFIDKLRELALAGDREAEGVTAAIEKNRASNDLANALKFERELLVLARDKFDLISPVEFVDLERVREDRNRCAHPSLVAEDQTFNPSAELARVHIRSAVTHLLQHQPVQGKYALARLLGEVKSEYFPRDVAKAVSWFASGPLKRPRDSLIRNLVVVLLKTFLDENTETMAQWRISTALKAIRVLHPAQALATVEEKVTALIRGVDDRDLRHAVHLVATLECWPQLQPDTQHRLTQYVESVPSEDVENLEEFVRFQPLQAAAISRMKKATRQELKDAFFFVLPLLLQDKYVSIYLASKSFAEANEWATQMCRYSTDFTADHQRKILRGVAENDQILGSHQLSTVISRLRKSNRIPAAEFDELLEDLNLRRFLKDEAA